MNTPAHAIPLPTAQLPEPWEFRHAVDAVPHLEPVTVPRESIQDATPGYLVHTGALAPQVGHGMIPCVLDSVRARYWVPAWEWVLVDLGLQPASPPAREPSEQELAYQRAYARKRELDR